MPQRAINPRSGYQQETLKRCPPFIDAMTYGFLILLATDLKVADGEFTWDFAVPRFAPGSAFAEAQTASWTQTRRS